MTDIVVTLRIKNGCYVIGNKGISLHFSMISIYQCCGHLYQISR
ncbi:hypothetical protein F383_25710 [Gossypium arboreum]|uniref:Uncharacterized protein n=1 Tax=Gossypium arboreum TaxID=29729 RepID=A0A0B0P5A4_GOSAR|nr:hypothetical protein F383_25710 [Gossypium arboreum]